MTLTSSATLPVLVAGLVFGVTALALVANELGKRANLSLLARLLLSGGLGMGVLSVGIKILIITVLTQTSGAAMARAGSAARETMSGWLPEAGIDTEAQAVTAQATRYRTWRALPDTPPAPPGNRSTPAKIDLGRTLFFDKNLSLDRGLACASCHSLPDGGDDNARYSTGHRGQIGDRNTPTVLNAAFLTRLFWDGRAPSLEAQAEGPFINPIEMAMPSLAAVEDRVRQDPRYLTLFAEAFPGKVPISIRNITRAIAAYERTLVTPETPYDRFVKGDDDALSAAALRGLALFDEVGCRTCHMDPVFSAAGSEKPRGVYRAFPVFQTDNPYIAQYDLLLEDRPARFRVPSLRNVALTAPYFHNGSVGELEEAIRIMVVSQLGRRLSNDPIDDLRIMTRSVKGNEPGRNLSRLRDRALSDAEVSDIAAFLRALSASDIPQ